MSLTQFTDPWHYVRCMVRTLSQACLLKTIAAFLVVIVLFHLYGWYWPRDPDKVKHSENPQDNSSSDIQRKFEDELEEAPYAAKMKAVLTMTLRFPRGASKVLDHLYLGAEADATSIRSLRELGITHIINCAEGYIDTGPSFYGSKFKYIGFDAEDDWDYNIMKHFPMVYAFIEDARTSGGKALIHCIMGINRSGALTVSYVMLHKHMGPISAAKLVKKARSPILSNEGFQRQVVTFAREKGLLSLDKTEVGSTL